LLGPTASKGSYWGLQPQRGLVRAHSPRGVLLGPTAPEGSCWGPQPHRVLLGPTAPEGSCWGPQPHRVLLGPTALEGSCWGPQPQMGLVRAHSPRRVLLGAQPQRIHINYPGKHHPTPNTPVLRCVATEQSNMAPVLQWSPINVEPMHVTNTTYTFTLQN